MSVSIKTNSHGVVDNSGFMGPITSVVNVGEYEIPLDEFCAFATYIMRGGILGWNGPIPECVQKVMQQIKSM